MLCRKPYWAGETPFGCGQCLPCRINRRRQWTWRQYLESLMHEESTFVTMTYSDPHLPEGGNLSKTDAALFLHRLRKNLRPKKIRFFLCGEYGPETLRPHYHVSIFGVGVSAADLMWETWGKCERKHFHVHPFNELTAQYISGYVVKKLTDSTDPRLNGRCPEFATMSRRPGIGSSAMATIAATLKTEQGRLLLQSSGDVPKTLKLGRRSIPLGRFLISKLRLELGMTPDDITAAKMAIGEAQSIELRALFETHNAVTADQRKEVWQKSVEQKILNTESRASAFAKRRTL